MIEPEVIEGIKAFPDTQAGIEADPVSRFRTQIGWYGTASGPRGSFAMVAHNGPHGDLVGDYVRITVKKQRALVYVIGSLEDPSYDLMLSRRAFVAVAPLWQPGVTALVEVMP